MRSEEGKLWQQLCWLNGGGGGLKWSEGSPPPRWMEALFALSTSSFRSRSPLFRGKQTSRVEVDSSSANLDLKIIASLL